MIIKVKVKPHSGQQSIERDGDSFIIRLKSMPEDNKANVELVKLLQRYFKKEVKIKRGLKSRNKILEVTE